MTYYGGKELAASFRTVRGQHNQDCRGDSGGQVRLPRRARHAIDRTDARAHRAWAHLRLRDPQQQGERPQDGQLHGDDAEESAPIEAKPRTKAEILAFLKSEGERFASYLEGLSDAFLAERVTMMPGDPSGYQEPVRDAARREGARDAPSRSAHAGRAHGRRRAAPDARPAGPHGAGGAGPAVGNHALATSHRSLVTSDQPPATR